MIQNTRGTWFPTRGYEESLVAAQPLADLLMGSCEIEDGRPRPEPTAEQLRIRREVSKWDFAGPNDFFPLADILERADGRPALRKKHLPQPPKLQQAG
jgi:hypothetical protein